MRSPGAPCRVSDPKPLQQLRTPPIPAWDLAAASASCCYKPRNWWSRPHFSAWQPVQPKRGLTSLIVAAFGWQTAIKDDQVHSLLRSVAVISHDSKRLKILNQLLLNTLLAQMFYLTHHCCDGCHLGGMAALGHESSCQILKVAERRHKHTSNLQAYLCQEIPSLHLFQDLIDLGGGRPCRLKAQLRRQRLQVICGNGICTASVPGLAIRPTAAMSNSKKSQTHPNPLMSKIFRSPWLTVI